VSCGRRVSEHDPRVGEYRIVVVRVSIMTGELARRSGKSPEDLLVPRPLCTRLAVGTAHTCHSACRLPDDPDRRLLFLRSSVPLRPISAMGTAPSPHRRHPLCTATIGAGSAAQTFHPCLISIRAQSFRTTPPGPCVLRLPARGFIPQSLWRGCCGARSQSTSLCPGESRDPHALVVLWE
jgi:hypothetical protein